MTDRHEELGERIVDALRAMVGALNRSPHDGASVQIGRLEVRMEHAEHTIRTMCGLLTGLGISVLTIVISMVLKGVLGG